MKSQLKIRAIFSAVLLLSFTCNLLRSQEKQIPDPPTTSKSDDPTVPNDAILRRLGQATKVSAQDLLDSAKRLFDAGLVDEAKKRVDQVQELEEASIEIQDEAVIWWSSVAPASGKTPIEKKEQRLTPDRDKRKVIPAKIPQITIKAIVMSARDKGTALLDLDGRQISIALRPVDKQERIPLPAEQFEELAQVSRIPTKEGTGKGEKSEFEFSPHCSFLNDGVIYNIERFTGETILLKALPFNRLILVRTENTP